jgi:hypothetical protein
VKWASIDKALPGIAAFVAQNDGPTARNAAQSIALEIAEAVDDGVVRVTLRGTAPDVPVFVLELDIVTVPVAEDAGFGSLVFQMEEAARYLPFLPLVCVDHYGCRYSWLHYADTGLRER